MYLFNVYMEIISIILDKKIVNLDIKKVETNLSLLRKLYEISSLKMNKNNKMKTITIII